MEPYSSGLRVLIYVMGRGGWTSSHSTSLTVFTTVIYDRKQAPVKYL